MIGCKLRPNSVGRVVLVWVDFNSQFRDFLFHFFQNLMRRFIFISGYANNSQAFSPPILFQIVNVVFLLFTGIFLTCESQTANYQLDRIRLLIVSFCLLICSTNWLFNSFIFWSRYPVDGKALIAFVIGSRIFLTSSSSSLTVEGMPWFR